MVEAFRPWVLLEAEKHMDSFAKYYTGDNWYSAWSDRRRKIKNTSHSDYAVDTDFQIVFFPQGKVTLGIPFCEHRKWRDEWLKQPGVEEYGYWNNSDEPEGMPAREWNQRKKRWNKVFDIHFTPAMAGFTVELMDTFGPMPPGWAREAVHKRD